MRNRIDETRVEYQRRIQEMSQFEFSKALAKKIENPNSNMQPLVSMWEKGTRSIPLKYLIPIAEILGVTEAYLIGDTDDPHKETPDSAEEIAKRNAMSAITYDSLTVYAGQPLFVAFPDMQHESGWAIYNMERHRFVFQEDIVSEKAIRSAGAQLYAKDISRITDPNIASTPVGNKEMMKSDALYVVMNSPDPAIRKQYTGWYRHNENKTALINEDGLCLPYRGLGISYNAYVKR